MRTYLICRIVGKSILFVPLLEQMSLPHRRCLVVNAIVEAFYIDRWLERYFLRSDTHYQSLSIKARFYFLYSFCKIYSRAIPLFSVFCYPLIHYTTFFFTFFYISVIDLRSTLFKRFSVVVICEIYTNGWLFFKETINGNGW